MSFAWKLIRNEWRLFLREPLAMTFVVAFPVITVLVLGGVFEDDDPTFGGASPSDYYVAAYVAVVIAAVGLVMVPVHVATYRERGVIRRFDAAGVPRWAFPASQFVTGLLFVLVGILAVWLTGLLSYGVPPIDDLARTVVGTLSGALAFISIGVLLGVLLPNARAAQGVGMLLFFPMFLLAGGGPPPGAMSDVMADVSTWLPLTHVTRAIQEPWLGLGTNTDHVVVNLAVFAVATVWWLLAAGVVVATGSRAVARPETLGSVAAGGAVT
jgi:ABC-2 type transport system permease protein